MYNYSKHLLYLNPWNNGGIVPGIGGEVNYVRCIEVLSDVEMNRLIYLSS